MRFLNQVLGKTAKQEIRTESFTMDRLNVNAIYNSKLKIMARIDADKLKEYMALTSKKIPAVKKELDKLLKSVIASPGKDGDMNFITPKEMFHIAESVTFYLQTSDGHEVTSLADLDWLYWRLVEIADSGVDAKVVYSR